MCLPRSFPAFHQSRADFGGAILGAQRQEIGWWLVGWLLVCGLVGPSVAKDNIQKTGQERTKPSINTSSIRSAGLNSTHVPCVARKVWCGFPVFPPLWNRQDLESVL
jgi:hypothetical protein